MALILALVALFSNLIFRVNAQDDSARVKARSSANYRPSPASPTFLITQGPDGNAVCRQATQAEAEELSAGPGGSGNQELRQINHLKTEASEIESATGLTIVLRATAQLEANAAAKQAFINAAAKWESLIKDPITINVDVDFGPTFFGTAFTGPTILGATQSQLLFSNGNYPDLRQRLINHATGSEGSVYSALPASSIPTDIGSVISVLIASPLLRALGVLPAVADDSEQAQIGPAPRIGFNSDFGFDFDPSNGITSNQTDFDAVAAHEMGHLLGFNSMVGDRELTPSNPLLVSVWDLFRFRPGTANLGTLGTAQRILSSGGTQIQFNGTSELGLSTAKTDGTGGDGHQASHWKADEQSGIFIGLMDPTIARGVRETMTTEDQTAIDAFGYTIIAGAGPANDNFADAQGLSGSSGTVSGSNNFGTKEAGEPTNPAGTGGGKSVWYSWTAPATGQATFDTNGSTFDTILAVYTGAAVNGLTVIAANDDISPLTDPEPRNIQSLVTFSVTAGTIYRIQVDGFDGDQGNIFLHWSAPSAPLPTVQFQSPTGAIVEDAGSAVITVTRTGDLTGSVSVGYFTSDGTATVFNGDYSPGSGRLSFAPGDSSKSITVPITNDQAVEGNETFNVTLNNPSNGVTIGSPSTTVITITDDDAGAPNIVQFAASTGTVTEAPNGSSRIDLVVTRTGNTALAVSVNYATSDGTASERSDYLAALGTLRFANGETAKAITVFIVDDAFGEGPETFNVTLSNPVLCTLGSTTSMVVTINSNESVNGSNPVKDPTFNSDFFVRQQYTDFFNRDADASGLAFWKNQIDECTTQECREIRRINVSAAFFLSSEFQQTGYLVYKTYQAAFNSGEFLKLREFLPDTQDIGRGVIIGQAGADAQLEANKVRFFTDFVQRSAFLTAFPTTMTALEFVNKLNANTVDPNQPNSGGALTTSERDAIVFQLSFVPSSAGARAVALRSVAENSLFSSRQSNKAFVLMQYFGFLRRNPNDPPELSLDFGGYNFWLGKLNQFNGNFVDAEMVKAFIISSEYQQRFGP